MSNDKWYSTTDLANKFNVSRQTVFYWVRRGEFPNSRRKSPKAGSPIEIPASDVRDFEKKREQFVSPEDR